MVRRFPGHGAHTRGGVPAIDLETVGARSGKPRHTVLGYLEEGSGSWLIIASIGGAARNPSWLHNLAKAPEGTIEFEGGRRVAVRAETLEGPQLEDAWARIAKDAPEYVKYRSSTDREIPVLRLRQR
jgi:deazaflavin-dependent oxidoreductase (nitroreductase family)